MKQIETHFHMEMLKTMKTKWAEAWGFIQCAGAAHPLQLQPLTSTSQAGRGGCHCLHRTWEPMLQRLCHGTFLSTLCLSHALTQAPSLLLCLPWLLVNVRHRNLSRRGKILNTFSRQLLFQPEFVEYQKDIYVSVYYVGNTHILHLSTQVHIHVYICICTYILYDCIYKYLLHSGEVLGQIEDTGFP